MTARFSRFALAALALVFTPFALSGDEIDIVVNAVEVEPDEIFPGTTIAVSVEYGNEGAEDDPPVPNPSGSFTINISVDHDQFGNFASGSITGNSLTSGEGSTGSTTIALPLDVRPGSYTVTATASGVSGDVDTSNNSGEATFGIEATPDLRITDLEYDVGEFFGGDVINMSITWENASTDPSGNTSLAVFPETGQDYRISVRLSPDPQFGENLGDNSFGDDYVLFFQDFFGDNSGGALVAGESVTVTWKQQLPGNFEGNYNVLARIDTLQKVAESQEDSLSLQGNNTWQAEETAKVSLLPLNFPDTALVSEKADGSNGEGPSEEPSITADGRFIVFQSRAAFVEGDTNNDYDIYLKDTSSGALSLITTVGTGQSANGASRNPVISETGRYIAFQSEATDLVPGDTNNFSDVFVLDRQSNAIRRVSVSGNGSQANGPSFRPDMSDNGRRIVFESQATNLVTGDTNAATDIFFFNFVSENTFRISVASDESQADGPSFEPRISGDGRWVAFRSGATNLVDDDTNGLDDIFVRQLDGGTRTERVSVGVRADDTLNQANGRSFNPALNEDGSLVVFASDASTLDPTGPADTNGVTDIILFDRDTDGDGNFDETGAIASMRILASDGSQPNNPTDATPGGLGSLEPDISADGQYIVFRSEADNLVPPTVTNLSDGRSFTSPTIIDYTDTNRFTDIYLYDTQSQENTRVSVNRFGGQTIRLLGTPSSASSRQAVISSDGRFVAMASDAENNAGLGHSLTNRQPTDDNGFRDVYVHDRRIPVLTDTDRPSVTFLDPGPAESHSFGIGATIPLTATGSIDVGQIDRIDFYANNVLIGSAEEAEIVPSSGFFTFDWTPTVAFDYQVTAIAVGSNGIESLVSKPVAITVTPFNGSRLPEPVISAPTDGSALLATAVTEVSASVSDPDGDLVSVQFFANGEAIGAPQNVAPSGDSAAETFTTNWIPGAAGIYALTVVATDNAGNSAATSATVTAAGEGGGDDDGGTGGGTGTTPQTLFFNGIEDKTPSSPAFALDATATSGLEVDFRIVSGNELVAINDGIVTLLGGTGTVVIEATQSGNDTFAPATAVRQSFDIQAFAVASTGTENPLEGLAYGNGLFVTVGRNGTILTSGNGLSWTARDSGIQTDLSDVIYANNRFVAVGWFGQILVSANGTSWSTVDSGTNNVLESITWTGDQFIAAGSFGTILTSPDGDTWTSRTSGTTSSLSVAVGDLSRQVVAGQGGLIRSATDGTSWTARQSGTVRNLRGGTVAQGRYLLTGDNGTVLLSSDGVSWTEQATPTSQALYDAIDTGSAVFAVGAAGTLLVSDSGINWTEEAAGTAAGLNAIAFDGSGTLVAVGSQGTAIVASLGDLSADSAFLAGSLAVSTDGWYVSDWFGLYNNGSRPWLFHEDLGWLYQEGAGATDSWLYHPSLGWLWTTPTLFPYVYSADRDGWLYYQGGTSDPAWFYNYATGKWIPVD
ncbi:MAG: Ig-like domain-containing protein [Opitutales bacterium]